MKPSDAYRTARAWADAQAAELAEDPYGRRHEIDGIEALSPLVLEAPVVHAVQRLCDFFETFPDPDDASAMVSVFEAVLEQLGTGADMLHGILVERRTPTQDQFMAWRSATRTLVEAMRRDDPGVGDAEAV